MIAALTSGGAPAQTPGKLTPALQSAVLGAGQSDRLSTWVFFADKGDGLAQKLAAAEENLTHRARARRTRNRGAGNLVDSYDIPVDPRYVAEVSRRAARLRHTSRWLNAVSIDIEAQTVDDIAALPFVEKIDLVRSGRSPLPEPVDDPSGLNPQRAPSAFSLNYGNSYAQNVQINVPPLHDQGYDGSGVLICMLDAGFNNLQHVGLQHLDIMVTRDFVNGDSIVWDQVGQMGTGNHGTWTLGAIGGYAPGEVIGPAYGATYILAKTENTDWERHIEEDAWVAGAEWADSIGADIISSSLGYSIGFTNGEPDYVWSDMDGNTTIVTIGADIAASRGILIVNSAGNDGPVELPANTLIGPCDGDSVLAVGAVDGLGVRTGFSSVGPTADNRTKPDVMAMGLSVRTVSVSDQTGYSNLSGTSLSCPLVAGAAALILQAKPFATNAEIMDALRQTASQSNAPDRFMGWGIVDATTAAAVIATGIGDTPQPAHVVLHPAFPNPFNPTTTIRYEIANTTHVRLTIFDVRGAVVTKLVDQTQAPGIKSVVWNGTNRFGEPVASGVYVYWLTAGGVQQSRKAVLLK
jgi:subtilisin family serine protease